MLCIQYIFIPPRILRFIYRNILHFYGLERLLYGVVAIPQGSNALYRLLCFRVLFFIHFVKRWQDILFCNFCFVLLALSELQMCMAYALAL